MAQDVPVPAEAARRVAISASTSISWLRENGYKTRATRVERAVAQILQATEGNDGEFVSVDGNALSSVTGRATYTDENGPYIQATQQYLKQYNVW